MPIISIQAAKTQLSRLVDDAAPGQEVIITRVGKPVARLVALAPLSRKRTLGILAGKLRVPADFDDPLTEGVLDAFEGRRYRP